MKRSEKEKNFLQQLKSAATGFLYIMPMMLGVILLVGLLKAYVTPEKMTSFFGGNVAADTLLAAVAGSLSAGQPIISYVIGGEMLENGISLQAVTAFVLSWVTLGLVQLPMEVKMLGLRFTAARNMLSFLFAIIIAFATAATLKWLQ
jgi:uncharacterized membrane protein YraQ (UPF0718 family)